MAVLAGCGQHGDLAQQPVVALEPVKDVTTELPAGTMPSELLSEVPRSADAARAGRPAPLSEGVQTATRRAVPRPAKDPWDALWGRSFASVRMTDGPKIRPHA